jgi:hypothetical protein
MGKYWLIYMRSFLVFEVGRSICHTKRGANTAAHRLPKAGVQQFTDRICFNYIPEIIQDVVSIEIPSLVSLGPLRS